MAEAEGHVDQLDAHKSEAGLRDKAPAAAIRRIAALDRMASWVRARQIGRFANQEFIADRNSGGFRPFDTAEIRWGSMMQITESPPTEQSALEARLLLREFSRRINNEFTSAIGAISIAAARSVNDEARAALAAVKNQLHNYAQVHHALQMPEHSTRIDAAAYLRQLCRAISRAKLDGNGIELRLAEQPFLMDTDRCSRLGLIVSELITNAERHAFHKRGGWIHVELLPSSPFVECRVTDNGTGEQKMQTGHGLRIVEELARGLGGTIDQTFGSRGTTAVLIFPIETQTSEQLAL